MDRPASKVCVLALSALALLGACKETSPSNTRAPEAATPPWLADRARQEADLAAQSHVAHDFRFTDKRVSSGITFENRVVDDAGKTYKLVHYDHGSGVCAADVDGDGLPDLYFATQLGTNQLWKNAGNGRFVNITDDGDGFDGAEDAAGQGLKNMRARAESIEGGFTLRSTPGRGTALEVVLRT